MCGLFDKRATYEILTLMYESLSVQFPRYCHFIIPNASVDVAILEKIFPSP